MAKSKTVFRCQQCGFESPKWNGKCPSCRRNHTVSSCKSTSFSKESRSFQLHSGVAGSWYTRRYSLPNRNRGTRSSFGRRIGKGFDCSAGRRTGHWKKHIVAANLWIFRGFSFDSICFRRRIHKTNQTAGRTLARHNRKLVLACKQWCTEYLRYDCSVWARYCNHRLHSDDANYRTFLQSGQFNASTRMHQSLYAYRKAAWYSDFYCWTCQQRWSDCRAKGHGAYCRYGVVFWGRTKFLLSYSACSQESFWFYQWNWRIWNDGIRIARSAKSIRHVAGGQTAKCFRNVCNLCYGRFSPDSGGSTSIGDKKQFAKPP